MPIDKATANEIGNPSGIAATAKAITNRKIVNKDTPLSQPTKRINRHILNVATVIFW